MASRIGNVLICHDNVLQLSCYSIVTTSSNSLLQDIISNYCRYSLGINSIWFNGLEPCLWQATGRSSLYAGLHISSLSSSQIKSVLGSVSLGMLVICSYKTQPLSATLYSQWRQKVISSKCGLFFFFPSTSSHPENTKLTSLKVEALNHQNQWCVVTETLALIFRECSSLNLPAIL